MACSSIKYLTKKSESDNRNKKAASDAVHALISSEAGLAALLIMSTQEIHTLPVVHIEEASA